MLKSVMALLFPLITFPYASRILLPEGIGRVNFANNIVSYFTMLAGLGIGTYAAREAARRRDKKEELSQFTKEIFLINLLSTVISYLLFLVCFFFIPKLSTYRPLLLVSSMSVIFSFLNIGWLYAAEEDFEYPTIRSIVFQILSLFILFFFVKTPKDCIQYISMGVFASVGADICNFIYSNKYISWHQKCQLNLKQHLKPIFVFFGMTLVVSLYTMLDTSMLGFLSNDTQVGFYTAATKLSRIVISVITSITGVLLPRFSYYAVTKQNDELWKLFNKSFKYSTYLSLPSIAGLCLLSRPLMLLLSGQAYLPAVFTMQVISPIILLISLSGLIGTQLFASIGKEKLTLLSVSIGAVVNFTLNSLLIPRYGANGAAIATVFAESSVTIFQMFCAKKYINIKEQFVSFLQSAGACIVMAVCVFVVYKIFKTTFIQTLISVITGCIVYAAVTLLLKNEIAIEIAKIFKTKFFYKRAGR